MGNAFALKITKINDNSFLKDVVFSQEKRAVEFVYYITKINKYYVENFRKNCTINEFTLCNVFTRKEYNVIIERVESGYFFEGLEYKVEILPNVEKVLVVSFVSPDGPGSICGINSGVTILIGNEMKNFSDLKDVEDEIKKMNANFIFYNFQENNLKRINFEQFRDCSNNQLRMGIEIEMKNVKEIDFEKKYFGIENISEVEKEKSKNNSEFKSHSISYSHQNETCTESSEILNEKQITQLLESQMDCEKSLRIEEEINQKKIEINSNLPNEESQEINIQSSKDAFYNSLHECVDGKIELSKERLQKKLKEKVDDIKNFESSENNLVTSKNIQLCEDEYQRRISSCNDQFEILESESHRDIKKDKPSDNFHFDTIEDEKNKTFEMVNEIVTLESQHTSLNQNGIIPNPNDEYMIDLKETFYTNSNFTKSSKTLSSFSSECESSSKLSPMINQDNMNNEHKQSDLTCNLKKCKRKYLKKLSIYDHIDSNYSFINVNIHINTNTNTNNNTPLSQNGNSNTKIPSELKNKIATDKNIKSKGLPKKKVLIKGFQLVKNFESHLSNYFKSFKIFELHNNTNTVEIIDSAKFI